MQGAIDDGGAAGVQAVPGDVEYLQILYLQERR